MSEKAPQKPKAVQAAPEALTDDVVWHRIIVRQTSVWRPPTDVYELEGKLVVLVEIGGMRDGDFSIILQNRRLIISGVRKSIIEQEKSVAYHQMEVRRGEFRTEVLIPWSIQRDHVTATYRDGLLRIELPQTPAKQIHIINVNAEEV